MSTSRIPRLEDLERRLGTLEGKRILVRTDFNVPLESGTGGERTIADDFRIRASLPTLEWLTSRGATVVTASHLGRPKGAPDPKYSMDPVRRVHFFARPRSFAPVYSTMSTIRFE